MPITVPRYNESVIKPERAEFARAHGVDPEAFGAGLAQGLSTLSAQLTEASRQQVIKANTAALLNARTAINAQEQERLYGDPNKPGFGILRKRGLAAAQDESLALENFKRWASNFEMGLANEPQKAAFRTMADERLQSMRNTLTRHTRKEMDWHRDETLKATEQSSLDRISNLYDNPDEVEREIQVIKFARNNRLDQEGVGTDPESSTIRSNYLKDAESKARGVVVSRMLDNGQYETALAYIEQHEDAFSHDEKLNIRAIKRDAEAEAARVQKAQLEQARQEANKALVDMETSGKLTRRGVMQYRDILGENEYREWNDRITRRAEKAAKAASGEGDGFKTDRGLQAKLFRKLVSDPESITESEIVDHVGSGLSFSAAKDLIDEKRRREKGEVDPVRAAGEKAVVENLKRARKDGLLGEGAEGEREYIKQTEAFRRWSKAHPKDDPSEYYEKVMEPVAVNGIKKVLDYALGSFYDPQRPNPRKRREEMEAARKPAGTPKVGDVVKGYRFKGGNPADRKAWVKL